MFTERFNRLYKEKGMSIQALAKATGLTRQVLYSYLKGSIPNIDSAKKIADCFGVTIGYLAGEQQSANTIENKVIIDIAFKLNKLDERDLQAVVDVTDVLANDRLHKMAIRGPQRKIVITRKD